MVTLGVDFSNYSGTLTPEIVQSLKDAGVGLAIVQAIDPPAGYPGGVTHDQIQILVDGGLAVDAYVWLWFDLDDADMHHKLSLLDGLAIRQLWLDVEDTAAIKYDALTCDTKVASALAVCDAYGTASGEKCGVYTGGWFWSDGRYMGNSQSFANRELWDSNYDNVADAAVDFRPYGGWSGARIKQYAGSTNFGGATGVDLNVLSVAEAAELLPPVASDRVTELETALGDVTARDGEIYAALAGATKLMSFIKMRLGVTAVMARLDAIHAQFLS